MAKSKTKLGRGPLSNKIIAILQQFSEREITSLPEYLKGQKRAENFLQSVDLDKSLFDLDPVHKIICVRDEEKLIK
ncbi:MAG: hypothetical protein AABZ60_23555 [Planctomycetota bacterium]